MHAPHPPPRGRGISLKRHSEQSLSAFDTSLASQHLSLHSPNTSPWQTRAFPYLDAAHPSRLIFWHFPSFSVVPSHQVHMEVQSCCVWSRPSSLPYSLLLPPSHPAQLPVQLTSTLHLTWPLSSCPLLENAPCPFWASLVPRCSMHPSIMVGDSSNSNQLCIHLCDFFFFLSRVDICMAREPN